MKQVINYYIDTPPNVIAFIQTWKRLKHYPQTPYLTIGECVELIKSTTRFFHQEDIASGVYNWLLSTEGVVFGYDGNEPIEILFYVVVQGIKKRLALPR